MIRHILCPIDFSAVSRRSADVAVALARQFGADITVAHVYSPALPLLRDLAYLAGPMALDIEARARFERELRELMEPPRNRGVSVRAVVLEGDPCAEIVALAHSQPFDLLVMGTHSREGLDRWLLGSVTERVLHIVRCPVVTVADQGPSVRPDAQIRTVLCAESLAGSTRTLDYALELVRDIGARLLVLHAIEELPSEVELGCGPFEYAPNLIANAVKRLRSMIPPEDRSRVEVAAVPGMAAEQILAKAQAEKPDLIVVGVHGRNPVDLMFFGATAQQVVRQAGCPVLTVHGGVAAKTHESKAARAMAQG